MGTAMIIVFILGYIFIALEHSTGINKTAIALVLGTVLWMMYIFAAPEAIAGAHAATFSNFISSDPALSSLLFASQTIRYVTDFQIVEHLGNVAEILFYLLGAMTIVELIDSNDGFAGITHFIKTKNKKYLVWLIALITFFMSSVLDNLTTAIVMVMLLRKLIETPTERRVYCCIVIIAANAGGVWTPIGDVTTIMLWINNTITSGGIMKSMFLPSLVSLVLPTWILSRSLKGYITPIITIKDSFSKERNEILICGILCLLSVPLFKTTTHLPPFMGILFALGVIWCYTEIIYKRHRNATETEHHLPEILSKIDTSTILFFLGILMAVAALEAIGVLNHLSAFLNVKIHNVYAISFIIGILSSVIDNVPLVAAAMGMYPVADLTLGVTEAGYMANFVQDGAFWELIAYCAGTGGSILIIGSAAGVVVMGLERINFIWYMKHISGLAILGYLAGLAVYGLGVG